MGGFAVAIDWAGPVDRGRFDEMCTLMDHRSTAGQQSAQRRDAALAEGRLRRDGPSGWQIATSGPLTIVGDIHLWNRRELAALTAAGPDLDDRQLLLAAFKRHGAQMMDTVDGDFAFVIWDQARRVAFAARDRFGVKPLFMTATPTGYAFASEPKQLVAYRGGDAAPSRAFAAQFLSGDFVLDNSSAFEDIARVMPAHTVTVARDAFEEFRYWNLAPTEIVSGDPTEIAAAFREQLIDSVDRRIAGCQRAVAQLSGGIDSPSIAASAAILAERGFGPDRLTTVATLFAGSETDESRLISKIVERQPFEHLDCQNRIPALDVFVTDMGTIDAPLVNMLRDVTVCVGETASKLDAQLVISGQGGDDVLSDAWVLRDILARNGWRAWCDGVRTIAGESSVFAFDRAVGSLRHAIPERIKQPIRSLLRRRHGSESSLLTPELDEVNSALHEAHPHQFDVSGLEAMARGMPSGHSLRILELQEAQIASFGAELTHPFLDRTVVEFVAGIDPSSRPLLSRDKALARVGFKDHLPAAVVAQRGKTFADPANAAVFSQHADELVQRFASIPPSATAFVDADGYASLMEELEAGDIGPEATRTLWALWTFMLWTESLTAVG